MRWPVDNFKEDWNLTAGLSFGQKTPYGYHCGWDINFKGGGDSDLGKDILAIAKGRLVYYHLAKHPTTGFGYHNVYKIEGNWGTRWMHQAHNLEDQLSSVQDIEEGQKVARVGKSGNVDYAHIHFAVFKVDPATLPNGIDTIAKTQQQLNDWWENPIEFIEKWIIELQPELDKIRERRDQLHKILLKLTDILNTGTDEQFTALTAEVEKLVGLEDVIKDREKKIYDADIKITDLQGEAKKLSEVNEALLQENAVVKNQIDEHRNTIEEQHLDIIGLTVTINDLKTSIKVPIFSGWRKFIVDLLSKL